MKKQSVAVLKKKADKFFSTYVRYRDAERLPDGWYGECITCNASYPIKQLQAGHFVSRRVNALRFEEENVNAQCTGCNMFKSGEQYAYSKALDLKYGTGTADRLFSRRFETHKFSISELEEIINDAREQIRFYEQEVT